MIRALVAGVAIVFAARAGRAPDPGVARPDLREPTPAESPEADSLDAHGWDEAQKAILEAAIAMEAYYGTRSRLGMLTYEGATPENLERFGYPRARFPRVVVRITEATKEHFVLRTTDGTRTWEFDSRTGGMRPVEE